MSYTILFLDYDLNIILMTSTVGYSDITCSLPIQDKLRHHPFLMHDVICVNEFPRKLMKFPRMEKVSLHHYSRDRTLSVSPHHGETNV